MKNQVMRVFLIWVFLFQLMTRAGALEVLLSCQTAVLAPQEGALTATTLFRQRSDQLQLWSVTEDHFRRVLNAESEHAMVAGALKLVKDFRDLPYEVRALLWEEVTHRIQGQVGNFVSQGFAFRDKNRAWWFAFQGRKEFEGGRKYWLVLTPDGEAFTGLAEPIQSVSQVRQQVSWLKRWAD